MYTAVLIIPTGIGASIGGYAGDGIAVVRALSGVCDRLITHPNVLNAAQLYWSDPNIFYVEGLGLDRFAAGIWGLRPVVQNRVGLLLDAGIEPELRLRHLQAADAMRGSLGLSLTDYVVTDAPLGVQLKLAASGASWGTLDNPGSLLRGAKRLIDEAGAEAIAVVARFPDESPEQLQDYRSGAGVDAIAGAEAVISHLIVREFGIPAAHAPALSPLPPDPHLSPRAAAEELGYTFLPCVLMGLSRAPQFVTMGDCGPQDLRSPDVDVVIVPEGACGGSAILSWSQGATQVITVRDNQTQMRCPAASLGIEALSVQSYLEAIGAIAAHRSGIDPNALRPHIAPLTHL
jgi:hypothetical protein